MKCLICEKECEGKCAMAWHVKTHNMSMQEYKDKFNLNIVCIKCGIKISKRGTMSGFCNKCRDRSGEKNPFYGKKHKNETTNKIKESSSVNSRKMWKDKTYRDKVISSATGLKRDSSFKETQKKNANRQFLNNDQRTLRSEIMKKTWADGKISVHNSGSESKIEKDFFNSIEEISPYRVEKKSLNINGKTYCPDIIIANRIIFEFYGDFWHGNPKKHSDDQMILKRKVKEIWERDEKRVFDLRMEGYRVYIVWESDYRKNKSKIIEDISIMLNWDEFV